MDWAQQRAGCAQEGSIVVQFSALYLSDNTISIYLSHLRAPVREDQSLAFPCADLGGLV